MLIAKEVNNDKLLEYTKQYVEVVNEILIKC